MKSPTSLACALALAVTTRAPVASAEEPPRATGRDATAARGEPASPAAALSIEDALRRVERLHPLVRERAAVLGGEEIVLRRAQWDRIRGLIGARGGYALGAAGASSSRSAATGDRTGDNAAVQGFADVRVPLYAGGAIVAAIDSASARVDAAAHDRRLAVEEQKRVALVAYAGLVAAREALAISERARAQAASLHDLAQARVEAGVGHAADVARARLSLLRRDEERAARAGEVRVSEALLRVAVLDGSDGPIAPTDTLAAIAGRRGSRRDDMPEVEAGLARVARAEADAKGAFAAYLPSVDLVATAAYGSGLWQNTPGAFGLAPAAPLAPSTTGPFSAQTTVGLMAGYRAFDFFLTRDRVASAEQVTAIERARLDEVRRRVSGRRREATERRAQAEARERILEEAVSAAAEAVRLSEARYSAGNAIFTDVLEAELERVTVEGRRLEASFDKAVAHVEWLRAGGFSL